jgi:hypothetical protein
MKQLFLEVISELKLVLKGKTLDVLLPPIIFFVTNYFWSLTAAMIVSLVLGLVFLCKRLYQHDNFFYAIGGILGILIANLSIYIDRNASNYFITDILGTLGLIIITIISLLIKKPLAIWVSHITRGWDLKWFYRKDIYPAYKEVTIFWLFYFFLRFGLELYLYFTQTFEDLLFFNVILGFPILILVLTLSYIYGIARLRYLKGPGIEEFKNNTPPPWKGQRKGF